MDSHFIGTRFRYINGVNQVVITTYLTVPMGDIVECCGKVTTGRTLIGTCPYVYSIYTCEFFRENRREEIIFVQAITVVVIYRLDRNDVNFATYLATPLVENVLCASISNDLKGNNLEQTKLLASGGKCRVYSTELGFENNGIAKNDGALNIIALIISCYSNIEPFCDFRSCKAVGIDLSIKRKLYIVVFATVIALFVGHTDFNCFLYGKKEVFTTSVALVGCIVKSMTYNIALGCTALDAGLGSCTGCRSPRVGTFGLRSVSKNKIQISEVLALFNTINDKNRDSVLAFLKFKGQTGHIRTH